MTVIAGVDVGNATTEVVLVSGGKILAAAGIAQVKYRLDYRNDPLVEPLLAAAGVTLLKLE